MARALTPEVVSNVGAQHGEGPVWHPVDRTMDWTDIAVGHLHRFDPATGRSQRMEVGSPLGSFAPRACGGYVLAVEAGFAFLDVSSGNVEVFAPVCTPEVRMNDGKCDPEGRFWAGTMSKTTAPRRGALYRLDPDLTVTVVLRDVTMSNGLDWTNDGKTLYYVDSLDGAGVLQKSELGIDAFEFDGQTGSIRGRRRAVPIPNVPGGPTWMTIPDGMTVDAEDCLWVAVPGSGEVRRYTPNGDIDTVIEMPVCNPTSVAFGGEDLKDLYITSMTLEVSVPPQFRRHDAFSQPRPLEEHSFAAVPASLASPPGYSQDEAKEEPLKISARNIVPGTVKRISPGAVNAEVVIEIAGGVEIVSSITKQSVDRLGLAPGKAAYAVIKATSVMIAVD